MTRFLNILLMLLLAFPANGFLREESVLAPMALSYSAEGKFQRKVSFEKLYQIPLEEFFPSGEFLSWEKIKVQLGNKFVALSEEDLRAWINHWIVNGKIARVFAQSGNEKNPFKITFCRYDYAFVDKDPKSAFFTTETINSQFVSRSIVETGFMDEVGGVLGFTLPSSEKAFENANERATVSQRFRSRTINLMRDFPETESLLKEESEAYQAFLDISVILIQKLDKASKEKNEKEIKKIERSFQMTQQMAFYKADKPSILAALLMEWELTDFRSFLQSGLFFKAQYFQKIVHQMQSLLFAPAQESEFSLQNYFHAIRQMSRNASGNSDLGIQLAFLIQQVESFKDMSTDDPDFPKQLLHAKDVLLHQIASKGGLGPLKTKLEDYIFEKERPILYKTLKSFMLQEIGISRYDALHLFLEGPLLDKIKKALLLFPETVRFQYRFRVKSLYSLWKKLASKIDKEYVLEIQDAKESDINDLMQLHVLPKLQYSGDRERHIHDFFGVQLIFHIPPENRLNSKGTESQDLIHLQEEIIEQLKRSFKTRSLQKSIEKKPLRISIEKKYFSYLKDFFFIPLDEKSFLIEIQVLDDMDSQIEKQGLAAHWIHDLMEKKKEEEKKYRFDEDLLSKFQHKFKDEYFHDEHLIFDELDTYVFTVVCEQKENGHLETQYLRLPQGSLPIDAASASSIELFNLQYQGAFLKSYSKQNQVWKNSPLQDDFPLQNGQIISFNPVTSDLGYFFHPTNRPESDRTIHKSKRAVTIARYYHCINGKYKEGKSTLEEQGRGQLQTYLQYNPVLLSLIQDQDLLRSIQEIGRILHLGTSREIYYLSALLDENSKLDEQQKKEVVSLVTRDFFREQLNRPFEEPNLESEVKRYIRELRLPSNTSVQELFFHIFSARIRGKKMFEDNFKVSEVNLRMDSVLQSLGLSSEDQLYQALGSGMLTENMLSLRFSQTKNVSELRISFDPAKENIGLLKTLTIFLDNKDILFAHESDMVVNYKVNKEGISMPIAFPTHWKRMEKQNFKTTLKTLFAQQFPNAVTAIQILNIKNLKTMSFKFKSINDFNFLNRIEASKTLLEKILRDSKLNIFEADGKSLSIEYLNIGWLEDESFRAFLLSFLKKEYENQRLLVDSSSPDLSLPFDEFILPPASPQEMVNLAA